MNYHKIEKTSVANGTGIRVVLWVSGCTCRCPKCHNPETWDFNSGKPFDEAAKRELFEALDKSYIQGITFSGGHPLEKKNIAEVYELIMEIRNKLPEKDIWLYTGYKFENIEQSHRKVLEQCDVVVDGKYVDELRDITLKWRGSKNQRVIDIKKTLNENKIVLYED